MGILIAFVLFSGCVLSISGEAIKNPSDWQQLIEQSRPEALRDQTYNNLCIQNVATDEYLFAGGPSALVNQRQVHTTKVQPSNGSFQWQIYFTDNGTTVMIKNNKYNEHIYVLEEGSREDDHVLRSWMSGSSLKGDSKAEFFLHKLGNGQFLIVNKFFSHVLFSPFTDVVDNDNDRPVFSTKYDPKNIKNDSKWVIATCELDG